MAGLELDERRDLLPRLGDLVRAARANGHICGACRRLGGTPSIGRSFPLRAASSRGIDWRRPSVYGWRGRSKTSSAVPVSMKMPAVHHVHAVAHPGDDAEVVRDQDQRRVAVCDELPQQPEDLRLDRDVERRRGLVGDQQLRLARERDRDHRALSHPARELVRVVLRAGCPGSGSRPGRAALPRARAAASLPHPEVRLERLADLLADGQDRVQARHRVLEDHRDLAARGRVAARGRRARADPGRRSSRCRSRCARRAASSPSTARDVTDLPQPDSPTMPRVSPAAMSNEMPFTAWTGPRSVSNRHEGRGRRGAGYVGHEASGRGPRGARRRSG